MLQTNRYLVTAEGLVCVFARLRNLVSSSKPETALIVLIKASEIPLRKAHSYYIVY